MIDVYRAAKCLRLNKDMLVQLLSEGQTQECIIDIRGENND